MSKIRMYLGLPSNGTVIDSQAYILRDLQERYSEFVEFVYPPVLCQRIFHDAARNGIVEDFLDSGADVLWFLDSDVTPPRHVLDLITMHWDKWVVAGAPYPIFMSPTGEDQRQVVFTAYKSREGKGLHPSNVPSEGTEYIDGLATGCLFIKREVFAQLSKPYFEFKFDPITRAPIEGEDLGFCFKMQALGHKFFTDYSMVCRHQKSVDLLEVNNYAMLYAQRAVAAYDAEIRTKMEIFNQKVRAQKAAVQAPKKSSLILPEHLRG